MSKVKIYDCITFFDENFLTNLRFEILNDVVDYFVEGNLGNSGKPSIIINMVTGEKLR